MSTELPRHLMKKMVLNNRATFRKGILRKTIAIKSLPEVETFQNLLIIKNCFLYFECSL